MINVIIFFVAMAIGYLVGSWFLQTGPFRKNDRW